MSPFVVFALVGLVALLFSKGSGAAAGAPGAFTSGTVTIKPGETWMLTTKAVGMKFTAADETNLRAMAVQVGTVQSFLMGPDGEMAVLVMTYNVAAKVVLGELVGLTNQPGTGIVITEAQILPAGGPQPPNEAPPPIR